jgi:hypothetical protein
MVPQAGSSLDIGRDSTDRAGRIAAGPTSGDDRTGKAVASHVARAPAAEGRQTLHNATQPLLAPRLQDAGRASLGASDRKNVFCVKAKRQIRNHLRLSRVVGKFFDV